jgi:lipoprotein-releasing system ATP-binding protein
MSQVQSPISVSDNRELTQSNFGHWTLDIRLRVRDLRKSFQSPTGATIEVLRRVSFSITPGEAVAVVGSSGAGKSTLLHLLAGIETPDHGSIQVGDFDVDSASPRQLSSFRNRQVGLVFQFHHLLKDLTALENVMLPLMMQRKSKVEASEAARSILDSTSLGNRYSHLIGNLSGGEQQRVAVCRALITRPSLVLADEPTGNLDAGVGDEIINSLISYARKTPAIVAIATHNQVFAEKCDRRLMLNEGRVTEIPSAK